MVVAVLRMHMPDDKRGRERSGRRKRRQLIEREIQRERAVEQGERDFYTPMEASYRVNWDPENPRTIRCEGFEELVHGVVLFDSDERKIAYIPHDNLIEIAEL